MEKSKVRSFTVYALDLLNHGWAIQSPLRAIPHLLYYYELGAFVGSIFGGLFHDSSSQVLFGFVCLFFLELHNWQIESNCIKGETILAF